MAKRCDTLSKQKCFVLEINYETKSDKPTSIAVANISLFQDSDLLTAQTMWLARVVAARVQILAKENKELITLA
jgi:hypothetical protein